MFCSHCGKEIADSQEFCQYCGARVGAPTPGAGAREKTPWEDRAAQGAFSGLLKTGKGALFSPSEFFRKMSVTGGFTDPLLYAMIVGMVGLMFLYFWDTFLHSTMRTILPPEMRGAQDILQNIGIAVLSVLSPLLVILFLFVLTGMFHLLLLMVRGVKAGFEGTFRSVAYSFSSMIFLAVPFCGRLIAMVWFVVLVIIGIKEAHETSGGKATFAVLFPFVLCCGFAIAVALLMMGVMAASIGATAQH